MCARTKICAHVRFHKYARTEMHLVAAYIRHLFISYGTEMTLYDPRRIVYHYPKVYHVVCRTHETRNENVQSILAYIKAPDTITTAGPCAATPWHPYEHRHFILTLQAEEDPFAVLAAPPFVSYSHGAPYTVRSLGSDVLLSAEDARVSCAQLRGMRHITGDAFKNEADRMPVSPLAPPVEPEL